MQSFNFTIHPNLQDNQPRISIPALKNTQLLKQNSSPPQLVTRYSNNNFQIMQNPNIKNYFIDYNRKVG